VPWVKGVQNGSKKGGCFLQLVQWLPYGIGPVLLFKMLLFFVTGQIGMKFGQKASISVLY